MVSNFIKTSDPATIKYLRGIGFKEVKSETKTSNVATFVNDACKPITFSNAKFVYTNKIEL